MSARKTTEEIQSQLAHRGITFLRDVPAKGVRRGLFQCEKLHQWEATISSVCQSGNGCAECAGKKRLTVQDINLRLKDRGITLLSGYTNVNGKALFECPEGHRWETLVLNVLARSGCRECCTNVLLTKEIVNERLKEKGVWIVGEYKGINKKTEMQCNEGHIWIGRPAEALQGVKGCPKCAGVAKLSVEEINERLSKRGIRLISGFTKSANKANFRCSFGHEWEALVGGVLSTNGCPKCSYRVPFDYNKPTVIYLYHLKLEGKEGIGFGISNNFINRHKSHSHTFQKTGCKGELLSTFLFETGRQAYDAEKEIKTSGKCFDFGIYGFRTECANANELDFIIDILQKHNGIETKTAP